jgi:hypothetical protein
LAGAEPEVLQEGESEHAHQGVVVQPAPGATLEVIEAKLLLHLLMHLLAHPAPFDHRCQDGERRRRGMVREVILPLA